MYSVAVESEAGKEREAARDAVVKLAQARARVAKFAEVVEERRAIFQRLADQMPEYWAMKAAEDALKGVREAEAAADQDVRAAALEAYQATGRNDPVPGVKIKLCSSVRYDPDAAFEWAQSHMPAVLMLDKKRFEAAALALKGSQMPVEIVQEPKVYIDKCLPVDVEWEWGKYADSI